MVRGGQLEKIIVVEIVELGLEATPVAVWFLGLVIAVLGALFVLLFVSSAGFGDFAVSKWLPVAFIVGLGAGALFSFSTAPRVLEAQAQVNAVGDIESVYGLKFSDDLDSDEVVPTDEGFVLVPGAVSNDGSVFPMVMVVREGNMLTVHASEAKGVEFVELEPVASR